MSACKKSGKPRCSAIKEQSAPRSKIRSKSSSKLSAKPARDTIKKSPKAKALSVAQPTGRKWTLQEEIRLLALFIAVGPDWSKISEHLDNRQPSTIKCKLNNMLRYALMGASDRIDDVGRFTKHIANEIKSKNYTLLQYHSQHLSKIPLEKIEPFLRRELNIILPQLESQAKREHVDSCILTNKSEQKTTYLQPLPFSAPQQLQPMPVSDYSDAPTPQPPYSSWFNNVFPYPSSCSDSLVQWKPLPCDSRGSCQLSLSESSFRLFPPGLEAPPLLHPIASSSNAHSTPVSAFPSLDPPYNNEICGYSLRVPIN
ncbi:Hypothetical protein DHA2_152655 [Giardia duodenalis]|uniref:Uncharacterized protein n=1 Tax=Giardia intestinalis TaxID=5741 RepID=V6TGW4_GIAIN|nr:Hypothetical protein DHA2_152655 [Giardia intestinalis]